MATKTPTTFYTNTRMTIPVTKAEAEIWDLDDDDIMLYFIDEQGRNCYRFGHCNYYIQCTQNCKPDEMCWSNLCNICLGIHYPKNKTSSI